MQMNATPTPNLHQDPTALRQAWTTLLANEPRLRIRDAAARLGVSEAELRATECGGHTKRLHDDFKEILLRLPLLGEVMALTRNHSAVHEKVGVYRDISFHGPQGLVLGHDIDLRLFLARWDSAFAVDEGEHQSLHFFDAHGDAVHKVHLREASEHREFKKLVEMFRADDQSPQVRVKPVEPAAPPRPDEAIEVEKFQESWLAMKDTHEFFMVLRRHGVARTQALRLAPPGHARLVANNSLRTVLERASATTLPIMVFVANPGCIQIHTGPVHRVAPMGPWINVMDPGFNLHLREDHIAASWVVRKPTSDGIVTSLELFDAKGETIALLFGARKPGKPEDPAWRELAEALASVH